MLPDQLLYPSVLRQAVNHQDLDRNPGERVRDLDRETDSSEPWCAFSDWFSSATRLPLRLRFRHRPVEQLGVNFGVQVDFGERDSA